MTTATTSPRRLPISAIGPFIAAALRTLSHRLRTARQRRTAGAQLEKLPDRLRQDIGLADSSPSAAELQKRFQFSRQTLPREHESRFKLWL